MRKLLLLTAALTLIAAFPASDASPQGACNPYTQGSWVVRTAFPPPGVVRSWGTFFPANGRFYAMGGRASDAGGSDYVNPREYNPITEVWTTKAAAFANGQVNNMVGGVLTFGATPFIVVVGGSAAGQTVATSDVRQYDPVTDSLTVLATDPWPGNVGGTVLPGGGAVFNNKLYVLGGFNINVGMTTQIYQFDPAAAPGSRWTLKTAALPAPGLGYIPTATSGNFIYLAGGSLWDPVALIIDSTSSLRYDPTLDAITTIATIPRATGETRAVTQPFDGSIWVLGGGRTLPNPSNEVDVYLPASDTWMLAPSFSTARRNLVADVDPATGMIWATGGYGSAGTPVAINEEFSCVIPVELMSFGVE